jgi:hypothetical protein
LPYLIVFNHLPRTAGLTLTTLLATWRHVTLDYQSDDSEHARNSWLARPLHLDQLAPGSALVGHYTGAGRLSARYPHIFDDARFRLVTFLRDPWATALSALGSSAGQHLLAARAPAEAAMSLAGAFAKALDVPPLAPREALARYWFVGLTERLETSMQLLARRLGHAAPEAMLTHNARTAQVGLPEQPPSSFRAAARDDYALYDIARARLEQEAAE